MVVVFFFAGVYYAGITGAAEGQGLAGGAIILSYGVITAFVALLVSVVITHYVSHEIIIHANQILGIIFMIFIAITAYRLLTSERPETVSEPTSLQITKSPSHIHSHYP